MFKDPVDVAVPVISFVLGYGLSRIFGWNFITTAIVLVILGACLVQLTLLRVYLRSRAQRRDKK